jgi:hypothetical protein
LKLLSEARLGKQDLDETQYGYDRGDCECDGRTWPQICGGLLRPFSVQAFAVREGDHRFSPMLRGGISGSGKDRIGPKSAPVLLAAVGDLPQLTLDRPRPGKCPAVYFREILVGRIKDEPARQPHGDADGAAFEFDCKPLHVHGIFSWRATGRDDILPAQGCSLVRLWKIAVAVRRVSALVELP